MKLQPARLLAGSLLTLAFAAPAADAAPVTVNLRVEGATRTLYQGPVTFDAMSAVSLPPNGGPHPCNVRDNTGNASDPVAPAPFGAIVTAAQSTGQSLTAPWSTFGSIGDFYVSEFGGDAENGGAGQYWGFAVNYAEAQVGPCQIPLSGGETVLFAYDYFNQNELLTLSGPTVMNVGEYAQFAVRNGRSNVGVTGATVAGSTTQDGLASVSFSGVGIYDLQATKPGALRSNVVRVCVHNGNDGNCGFPNDGGATTEPATPPAPPADTPVAPIAPVPSVTPASDTTPPTSEIEGIKPGKVYPRKRAPRELSGSVSDAGGVRRVELRLKRRHERACWSYDGRRERFEQLRCRRDAEWFAIDAGAAWSYLLPERLPAGRYVLDVRAVDTAGNAGQADRVRFRVA